MCEPGTCVGARVCVCVCVCVWERERMCVCGMSSGEEMPQYKNKQDRYHQTHQSQAPHFSSSPPFGLVDLNEAE